MADYQRSENAVLPEPRFAQPSRSTGVKDLLAGRPSLERVGFDLGNDSLMWDSKGQLMPTAERYRLTNPFLTLVDTQSLCWQLMGMYHRVSLKWETTPMFSNHSDRARGDRKCATCW